MPSVMAPNVLAWLWVLALLLVNGILVRAQGSTVTVYNNDSRIYQFGPWIPWSGGLWSNTIGAYLSLTFSGTSLLR